MKNILLITIISFLGSCAFQRLFNPESSHPVLSHKAVLYGDTVLFSDALKDTLFFNFCESKNSLIEEDYCLVLFSKNGSMLKKLFKYNNSFRGGNDVYGEYKKFYIKNKYKWFLINEGVLLKEDIFFKQADYCLKQKIKSELLKYSNYQDYYFFVCGGKSMFILDESASLKINRCDID